MRNHQKSGFTLIELAIVIVIISLIIGGVLKGQDLVESARVNSVINQVNSFRSAFISFQEKFGGLPGDLAQAQNRLPGCLAAATNCANGTGNGVIDTLNAGQNTASGAEGRMVWQHLGFANMISGVTPGAAVTQSVYGQNFPAARTGGGFIILHTSVGTPALSGHWLRLQQGEPNAAPTGLAGAGALTPSLAAQIDRRMDDGNPRTGNVRADGVAANCTAETGYNEQSNAADCNLYFLLQ